ncbi:hypothetical protein ANCCEY_02627 [Ancylostoma ceylanicum]|uniref:Uncharacterized protein n=1 Tax=Ancylostoma ceylanicum TaxID=53326 RepID=A0A0D6M418_9BILA|nr:hypothetical protein ANCCEY_02627 [Ancylostoma ceylanicum]
MNGAEWIYDIDDGVIPSEATLPQFDYSNHVSGLQYDASEHIKLRILPGQAPKYERHKFAAPITVKRGEDMVPLCFCYINTTDWHGYHSDDVLTYCPKQSGFLERRHGFASKTMGNVTSLYEARSSSETRLEAMHDLDIWCKEAHPMGLPLRTTSAAYLEKMQNRNEALTQKRNTVLIIINNFPWKNNSMGLLERIYGSYFGITIFCGKFMKNFESDSDFPAITSSFSFIEVYEEELLEGYFLYYCLAKVAEMRLRNVEGTSGLERVLELVTKVYKDYPKVQTIWQKYKHGIKENYRNSNTLRYMASANGYAASDLFYVPTAEINYFAGLMELFFEAGVYKGIAVIKFLATVKHTV